MSKRFEIIAWLRRYLAGEITLNQFEDWLVPHSWNCHQWNEHQAAELVYDLELSLWDWQDGGESEDVLKAAWQKTLDEQPQTETVGAQRSYTFTFDPVAFRRLDGTLQYRW